MPAVTALLAVILFIAAPAPAAGPADAPLAVLRDSKEPAERIAACVALARDPARGTAAEAALSSAMTGDLSERVRLAAAKARATWFDSATVPLLDRFFGSEPDERVRADLAVTLSTEPAQTLNPDVTRVLGDLLSSDPSALVRRAAVRALLARDDTRVGPWLAHAIEKDSDAGVRAAATHAAKVVAARPAPKKPRPPKPVEPSPEAVKGVDKCPEPWAWCECGVGAVVRAHCLRRDECVRRDLDSYRPLGQGCSWNGVSLRPDETSRENGEKTLE
jgi:hypothetical protein